jgi:hypothetical protein
MYDINMWVLSGRIVQMNLDTEYTTRRASQWFSLFLNTVDLILFLTRTMPTPTKIVIKCTIKVE